MIEHIRSVEENALATALSDPSWHFCSVCLLLFVMSDVRITAAISRERRKCRFQPVTGKLLGEQTAH